MTSWRIIVCSTVSIIMCGLSPLHGVLGPRHLPPELPVTTLVRTAVNVLSVTSHGDKVVSGNQEEYKTS